MRTDRLTAFLNFANALKNSYNDLSSCHGPGDDSVCLALSVRFGGL